MDDAVDALFALPPSEFTAARNALVKRLRAEKRRDEAEAVKSLRRPNVAAWAINQVAREDPAAIERVIQAGAAVGAAQRRALSGVRDAGLREASTQRREAVEAVWRVAAERLHGEGTDPAAHRQAIAATLEAASVDPQAADLVRRGRLSVDLPPPSGFGEVAGFKLVPDAGDAPAPTAKPAEEPAPEHDDTAAREALAEAHRLAQQARRRADDLQDRAAEARRTAVRAADEAERLERRAAQARRRAEEENAAADELAASAEAANRAAEQAVEREEGARGALSSHGGAT